MKAQETQGDKQDVHSHSDQTSSLLQDVAKMLVISETTFNTQLETQQQKDGNSNDRNKKSSSSQKHSSSIFVWGNNSKGQLSLNSDGTQVVQDPKAVSLRQISEVKSVACGAAHTLILSDAGVVLALGDNAFGQLGVPKSQVSASRHPIVVEQVASSQSLATTQVYCSLNSSFALLKADNPDVADEIYTWGSLFGIEIDEEVVGSGPQKVEFANGEFDHKESRKLRIKSVSVGDTHAALITQQQQLFCWGTNHKGQLGTSDTQNKVEPQQVIFDQEVKTQLNLVSCGADFTFVVTGQNEIKVAGQLPFKIMIEEDKEQDYVSTFQSIAQFDQRVNILQIESSGFASMVIDPQESEQPKELFFWGRSPVGCFNELTSLNQLFDNKTESGASPQIFDVQAVRNGANFCVFVDQQSGMTYQIGAENFNDPYIDDALVSLSELRDAQFSELDKFACGSNFVIGQSLLAADVSLSSSLMRKQLQFKGVSPIKKDQNGDRESQGFLNGLQSVSSSSPDKNSTSFRSISEINGGGFRFMQGLINRRSSSWMSQAAPKIVLNGHSRVKSCMFGHQMKVSDMPCNENFLNKTTELAATQSVIAEEEMEDEEKPVMVENKNESTTLFHTQSKIEKKQQSMSSPNVSPINQQQQNNTMITASRVENEPYWIDGMSYSVQETVSADRNLDQKHFTNLHNRRHTNETESQMLRSPRSYISANSKMTNNQKVSNLQQSFPKTVINSPDTFNRNQPQSISNHQMMQPVFGGVVTPPFNFQSTLTSITQHQKGPSNGSGVPQQPQQYQSQVQHQLHQQPQQQQHHHCAQMTMGMPPQMMDSVMDFQRNQSHLNCSGFLAVADQQQSFYEHMLREKQEIAQLQGQLMEAQRQLDKSRKEYGKLLKQVGKDKDDTDTLRGKIQELEASLISKGFKQREQEAEIDRNQCEKAKLEADLKKQALANRECQAELLTLRCKVKEIEQQQRNECINEACRQSRTDFQAQNTRKSKEIYELTVKLGCIQSENIELKTEIQQKNSFYESNLDSIKSQAELDIQKAQEQVQELKRTLINAQAEKFSEDKCSQTENQQQYHHLMISEYSLPTTLGAVYESLNETLVCEIDETCDISELNMRTAQVQGFSAEKVNDSLVEKQSLKEFQMIEESVREETQSSMMDYSSRVLQGSAQRMMQNSNSKASIVIRSIDSQEDQGSNIRPQHNFMKNKSSEKLLSPKILRISQIQEAPVEATEPLQVPKAVAQKRLSAGPTTSEQTLLPKNRAKSNSENGCLQIKALASKSTTATNAGCNTSRTGNKNHQRRLRHQRQADAARKSDGTSQISYGSKTLANNSSMSTTMRISKSIGGLTQQSKASRGQVEGRKSQIVGSKPPNSARNNQIHEKLKAINSTQHTRNNPNNPHTASGSFLIISNYNPEGTTPQTSLSHRGSIKKNKGLLADKNLNLDLRHAQTYQQSVASSTQVTPRMRSRQNATLCGNAENNFGRQYQQQVHSSRQSSESSRQVQNSASRRAAAYDIQRKNGIVSSAVLASSMRPKQCEACQMKLLKTGRNNSRNLSSRLSQNDNQSNKTPRHKCESVASLDEPIFSQRSRVRPDIMNLQTEDSVFSSIDTVPVVMSARDRRPAPKMTAGSIATNLINQRHSTTSQYQKLQTAREFSRSNNNLLLAGIGDEVHLEQKQKPRKSEKIAKITLQGDRSPFKEKSHLQNIQDKLQIIQTGKQLLTQKIQEYESKLKTIQAESDDHIAIFSSQRSSAVSQENNIMHDQSQYGSNFTLGESTQPGGWQMGVARQKEQQIRNSMQQQLKQPGKPKAYRECRIK